MFERKVIDEIEDVFVNELGMGSSIIIEKKLHELGLSREAFKQNDVDDFVSHLLSEYEKVLGNHSKIIRSEINKRLID